ncbi:PTS sugar transporter subunit IIA [Streptococcus sobrinus]|uniref:PTS sugar transporter subunit IIA n=1 Tax=Streptococcus sobrinus TaxID=1310 RepID=UPI0002E76AE2|nr:PTS sugar transporter subunit IIA [Streptococcus sobrinus]
MTSLIHEDTVFVSNGTDQTEIFKEIASKLLAKDLVTEDFVSNLIEREKNYPTALPLKPINLSLPNIAIPHTESEFVKDTRIVPVKLENPIIFKNMILPDQDVVVSFLFMILNHDEREQAGLLQNVMDFINRQDAEELIEFFKLENSQKIYKFLEEKF